MSYKPPDTYSNNIEYLQNINSQGNHLQIKDESPLLRPFSPNKNFKNNGSLNSQNRNNYKGNQQYNKPPIYNRLGKRNFQHNRNNNVGDNKQGGNSQGQRMMYNNNRKRRDNMTDTNTGPTQAKRKWIKKPYYQNTNQQNHAFAQNRLEKIRNTTEGNIETVVKNENLNDSQDVDATDITVEVVNNTAPQQQEDLNNVTRFKMILNPKTQAAIKLIQSKRKDKQVVYPLPVTPNCTEISINERFSLL